MRNEVDVSHNIRRALQTFNQGQLELSQTARFVDEQRTRLNHPTVLGREGIERTFPDLDENTIKRVLAEAKPIYKFANSPAPSELDAGARAARTNQMDEIITDFRDRISKIVPRGYAYGCVDAIVSPLTKPARTEKLRSALLISLVAEFEVLISTLLGEAYRRKPDMVIKRTFDWDYVCSSDDLDSLKERAMEEAIMSAMYGSFSDWMDKFQNLGVKLPDGVRDDALKEIFQRRNVFVHNGGRASQTYVDKSKTAAAANLGDELRVSPSYFYGAADRLAAVGIALTAAVSLKFVKDPDEMNFLVFFAANSIYEFLTQRRFDAVIKAIAALNPEILLGRPEEMMCKVNYWLALKRLNRFGECREEVQAWAAEELGKRFELARLALLDNTDEGLQLMSDIRDTDELSVEEWVSWPLLEELRRAEAENALPHQLSIDSLPELELEFENVVENIKGDQSNG